jgi:hypothetical protein
MKRLFDIFLKLPLRNYSLLPIAWNRVVGDYVSRFARVSYYKNGTLYIDVPAPVWANELSSSKSKIIESLVKETDIPITEIKFRVYPFNIKEKEKLDLQELTNEDIEYINSLISDLKYEKLKNTIFNIIGYHLLRKKRQR